MKTPKRNKGNGYEADCYPFDGPNQTAFEHARWHRKNRIAQLKRTINRYRDCTNLPFYCHELHAYKLLQELKKPDDKATVNNWNFYTQRLLDIQSHIMQAIAQAGREAGACWEREKRKDQP